MKNEDNAPLLLYKIMSSRDLINRANASSILNNSTLNKINKIKEKLNPLKQKIKKYSRKISKNIKKILNTSDVITRAKKNSFALKDILLEIDKGHKKNISKFKNLREITNDSQNVLSNFIRHQKEEEEKNEILKSEQSNNRKKLNSQNNSNKSTVNEELTNQKIHKLLSDNILLMAKRREIFSYYLIKNKYQAINDEKKIRYIDKIREMLEIKQIQADEALDEKEKKAKLNNIKYYINQEKRIKKERQENYNKFFNRIKQENDISLRSIKETSATLRTLKSNKSYLDDEIKLKYEHIPPIISNRNSNKKRRIISRMTEIDNNISIINDEKMNESSSNTYNKYIDLIKSHNKENTYRANGKNTLIKLRRFILSKSTSIPKEIPKINLTKSISIDNQVIPRNSNNILLEDENIAKSRINSVYEEIKHNNILMKKDKAFMKLYFENKNMKLSQKHRQAITIMTNSLSRINEIDVTKKLKKIHGQHIPEKYVNFFDRLESINRNSNKMKCKIFDSLCKVKMDN